MKKYCKEDDVRELIFGNDTNGKHTETRKRYDDDKKKGVEISVVEYLYLPDLVNVISKKKLYEKLGFLSNISFRDTLGSLVNLRNTAAHPTKSIVKGLDSCCKLWEQIEKVESILFNLR